MARIVIRSEQPSDYSSKFCIENCRKEKGVKLVRFEKRVLREIGRWRWTKQGQPRDTSYSLDTLLFSNPRRFRYRRYVYTGTTTVGIRWACNCCNRCVRFFFYTRWTRWSRRPGSTQPWTGFVSNSVVVNRWMEFFFLSFSLFLSLLLIIGFHIGEINKSKSVLGWKVRVGVYAISHTPKASIPRKRAY